MLSAYLIALGLGAALAGLLGLTALALRTTGLIRLLPTRICEPRFWEKHDYRDR